MHDGPGTLNWIKLLFLGMIWGASFMAVSVALDGLGPVTIAAARITVGALCLLAIIRAMGISLPPITNRAGRLIWACAFGMGFFSNALPFTLLSWGQTHVASGFAGVCMAVVPLFVLPLSHFLVPGEHMTLRRSIGFLTGFAGVVVLIGLE
ncbi:MAG: DMT family transporter, partial [Phaeobacter gallaeciensis]